MVRQEQGSAIIQAFQWWRDVREREGLKMETDVSLFLLDRATCNLGRGINPQPWFKCSHSTSSINSVFQKLLIVSLSGIGTRIVKFLTILIHTSCMPLFKRWRGCLILQSCSRMRPKMPHIWRIPVSSRAMGPKENSDENSRFTVCFWRSLNTRS